MKHILKKNLWLIIGILLLIICFILSNIPPFSWTENQINNQINSELKGDINYINKELQKIKSSLKKGNELNFKKFNSIDYYKVYEEKRIGFGVINNDSMTFWTSNRFPFLKIHHLTDTIIKYKERYYYINTLKDSLTYIGIKQILTLDRFKGKVYKLYYKKFPNCKFEVKAVNKHSILFSNDGGKYFSRWSKGILAILLFTAVYFISRFLFRFFSIRYRYSPIFGLITFMLILLCIEYFVFYTELYLFTAQSDFLIPLGYIYKIPISSGLTIIVSSNLLIIYIYLIRNQDQFRNYFHINKRFQWVNIYIFRIGGFVLLTFVINHFIKLIGSLSLEFNINDLISYTVTTIVLMSSAYLLFTVVSIHLELSSSPVKKIKTIQYKRILFLIIFLPIVNYFFISPKLYYSIWIILILIWYIIKKRYHFRPLSLLNVFVSILIFSTFFGIAIQDFEAKKEITTRNNIAKQLLHPRDPLLEYLFTNLNDDISKDKIIRDVFKGKESNWKKIRDYINNRYFNISEFEGRLEISIFDKEGNKLIPTNQNKKNLDYLINNFGQKTLTDSNLYYIKRSKNNLSYIGRFINLNYSFSNAPSKKVEGSVYLQFTPKIIPESFGFEEMTSGYYQEANYKLRDYSFARYEKGILINDYGDFNYNTFTDKFYIEDVGRVELDYEGYNHLIIKSKIDEPILVISKKNQTWIDYITVYSYLILFSFTYVLLIISLTGIKIKLGVGYLKNQVKYLNVVSVGVVLIILGITLFIEKIKQVKNQEINEISKTLNIFYNEIIDDKNTINIRSDLIQYLSNKFNQLSNTYNVETTLYFPDGNLLSSSIDELYDKGYFSPYLDNYAFSVLKYKQKNTILYDGLFIDVSFHSAYKSIINLKGELVGFIGIKKVIDQSKRYAALADSIKTIINLIVLLLIIFIILSLIASNFVTKPLLVIKNSIDRMKLSDNNPIDFKGGGEIGLLVDTYNAKVSELEKTMKKMAQQEREIAWREVAKEVAHEIKNPLTPMKLTVQHLQHSYDPKNPEWREKLSHFGDTLLEQIDALVGIANSFSEFAKMPKPEKVENEFVNTIKGIIKLYENDESSKIELNTNVNSIRFSFDKNQISRVFNNLIKNAIQAKKDDNKPVSISINVIKTKNDLVTTVEDNGIGMNAQQLENIFMPQFTTKSSGMGLGLSVVKTIIEDHNGVIKVKSKENIGTVFTVTLPLI